MTMIRRLQRFVIKETISFMVRYRNAMWSCRRFARKRNSCLPKSLKATGFIAVRQEFTWTVARPPHKPGSRWEQWLVFPDGVRWFLAYDRVTSVNTANALMLRIDMPGHIRHNSGDTFEQIYLSYHGCIPSRTFLENFPPDAPLPVSEEGR